MSKRGDQGRQYGVKESFGALWRNSIQCLPCNSDPADGLGTKRFGRKHRFPCLLRVGVSAYCSRSTVLFNLKPKHPPTGTVIPPEATPSPAPGSSIYQTPHTHTSREAAACQGKDLVTEAEAVEPASEKIRRFFESCLFVSSSQDVPQLHTHSHPVTQHWGRVGTRLQLQQLLTL